MSPIRLTRNAAKQQLAEFLVKQMTLEDRAREIGGWWAIDEEDEEWASLPPILQQEMSNHDEPLANADDVRYVPLLEVAVIYSFKGARNEWLATKLAAHYEGAVIVVGLVESLEACPCCGYCTLPERGGYDICRVCFWEDDGCVELASYSGPNHQTLAEGRQSFRDIGACDLRSLAFVESDGREKYVAGDDAP